MSECETCGRDHEAVVLEGEYYSSGPACHCMTVDGLRVAVGICCGRKLGASLLREEDFHDGAPWAEPGDCKCQSGS